jgi:hypothetical protein
MDFVNKLWKTGFNLEVVIDSERLVAMYRISETEALDSGSFLDNSHS